MAISFTHKPYGSIVGSGSYVFRHYGSEGPAPEFTGLCFTANTAGSTVTLNKTGSPSWIGSYSTNGTTWNEYAPGTTGAITLSSVGDKVYFKGTLSAAPSSSNRISFAMTGSINASGNIMSLCSGDNYASVTTIPYNYCFYALFASCTSLRTPPTLPATTLKPYCYRQMFHSCSTLTTAPNLPATTLQTYCYYTMFYGCTSLTNSQILSPTTLATYCCYSMFNGCTRINNLPDLPALSILGYSYANMFNGCRQVKLSTTQTGSYTLEYRIPKSGTGSATSTGLNNMFSNTGGTFTGKPTINTTYYLMPAS